MRAGWNEYFMGIAHQAATRSTCDRKHVGAVIVRDRTVLSTGYNGSVRGLPHCDEVGCVMEDGHCITTVHAEANAILQAAKNGVSIEGSELFPNRTNVSFFSIDGDRVRARIFERGVGETLSSGTGASGAAVAAFLRGAPSPITVELDGGELEVEISPELDVTLSGGAESICAGELSADLLSALAELDG